MPCPASLRVARLLALASLALAASARAEPADYVFVPYAEKGAVRGAWGLGVESADGGSERGQTLSLGGSPTLRWYTEVYAGWQGDPAASTTFEEWSWRNQLLLTTPGASAFDIAATCALERPRERDQGTGLSCGALLQLDSDHVQFNLNPLFSRHLNAAEASRTTLGYQWQARTLVRAHLELGAQGFGDVGPWNHWADAAGQEHLLGPALFAKWPQGGGRALSLDTAWLFGVGAGSPDHGWRLRLEQKF